MPVFNAGAYIKYAIQSILDQTFTDFELIIINDGSTDNSYEIISSFSDFRIRYFDNPANFGIVYTRNFGIRQAQGQFIGMLDADDISLPDRFEKQVSFLERNREFAMVGSWVRFIDENGNKLKGIWKLTAPPEEIPSILLFRNYFTQSAVLVRKSCISNLQYREGFEIGEDYLLWIEISAKFKVWNIQKVLIYYRIHTASITNNQSLRQHNERSIFAQQVKNLGIEASHEELSLHLLLTQTGRINSLKTIIAVEHWLLKILDANSRVNKYNHKTLSKVVFNRWLKVCYKALKPNLRIVKIFMKSKITHHYLNFLLFKN